jgi:hypothetical protein
MALTKLGASRANRVNKSKHKQNGVASTLPSTAKDVRFLPLATLRAGTGTGAYVTSKLHLGMRKTWWHGSMVT